MARGVCKVFGMYACMCNGYVWLGESVSVFGMYACMCNGYVWLGESVRCLVCMLVCVTCMDMYG